MEHGTYSGYNNQGCRCETCRAAGASYGKGKYARSREQVIARTRAYHIAHPGQRKATQKRYRERHPERVKAAFLRRHYGISLTDYQSMSASQQGLCAICNQPETAEHNGRVKLLAVDHDATTGMVRGLLCQACNHGLGHFKDDPDRLERAAGYLRSRHR